MVYDAAYAVWNHYDADSLPTFVLIGADGQELGRWGRLDTYELRPILG